MIGKLIRGRSMRGLLEYLLSKKDQKGDTRPRVAIVGGSFAGRTARTIAQEFAVLRALRPSLGVAVVHETLRLPPNAAEPTDEEWLSIARYWTTRMGFEAWIAVAHGDGHIHIAASRIRIDGSVVSDSQDWTLSERIVREIEARFGLDAVEPSHLLAPSQDWIQQKALSQAQLAIIERVGVPLPSEILAASIDALLSAPISATDFVLGLEKAGFNVRPNIASTNKVSGLAYGIADVVITANALGRAYTWANLQRRGLKYDTDRDLPTLRAALYRSLLRDAAPTLPADFGTGVESSADEGSLTLRAAQVFASIAVANFVAAAGTDQFLVFQEPRNLSGPGFVEINDLTRPAVLMQILDGARFGSTIRAENVDCRIVVVTELGHEQVSALSDHGLQPFAVAEIRPDVFEASIRLLPSSDPEPSLKVHRMAAAIAAKTVGGQVSETIHLPGFFSPLARRTKRRRAMVILFSAARVIAELGAALLHSARQQLEKIGRELKTTTSTGDLLRPGHVAMSKRGTVSKQVGKVSLTDPMDRSSKADAAISTRGPIDEWAP